jgi:ABC-type nitrate/sulfonate/bicarbonate transport system substrate-binding protein
VNQRGLIKTSILTIIILVLVIGCSILIGCTSGLDGNGGPSRVKPFEPKNLKTTVYMKTDTKTYKFLNVQSSLPVPQAYYVFKDDRLTQDLNSEGFATREILDDVQEKILPNLVNGYYDFAYLPLSTLTEYWAGIEQQKYSGNYVIIAAAYSGGTSLLTAPDIIDLKKLDGKSVGIINQSYDMESTLNSLLNQAGLKTKVAGGSVDIRRDTAQVVLNSLLKKQFAAVVCGTEFKTSLQAMGYQDAYFWNQQVRNNPNMVLVVRAEILEKRPDVVTAVLSAHVRATLRAVQDSSFRQEVIKQYNQYRLSMELKQKSESEFSYDTINISYNPNRAYLLNVLEYMSNSKYLRNELNTEKVIDVSLLNKTLQEFALEQVN